MIWILALVLGAAAAFAVAAWARRSRQRVDAAVEAERAKARLDAEERQLLDKLKQQQEGEG